MAHHKFNLGLACMIFIITGCAEKDELTLPVRINLMFEGYLPYNTWVDPVEASYLKINEICFGISKIEVEGERVYGGNISFETAPNVNFPSVRLAPQMNVAISDFDIPQGNYDRFRCDLELKRISSELLPDISYVDTNAVGLVITGEYHHIWWSNEYGIEDSAHIVPFILLIDESMYLSFNSSLLNSNSSFVLSDNNDYKFILVFDFFSAFKSLPIQLFANAKISDNGLEKKLIINKYINKEQYEVLSQMLNNSLSLYVK